jgi:hypothetical protein
MSIDSNKKEIVVRYSSGCDEGNYYLDVANARNNLLLGNNYFSGNVGSIIIDLVAIWE